MTDAVFHLDGERHVPTELARGPWDPGAQHGGAAAAILGRAVERFQPELGLAVTRITFELRLVDGRPFDTPGPARMWFRLRVPVVGGEEPSPLQRVLVAADFGNGISSVLDYERFVFINPDLTVYVRRPPVGEWVGLDAASWLEPGGGGYAESALYDERSRIGRAVQALYVAPR